MIAKLLQPTVKPLKDAVLDAVIFLRENGKTELAGELLIAFEMSQQELRDVKNERDVWAAEAQDLVARFVKRQ